MKKSVLLILLVSGCIVHSRALQQQCHELKVGMSFAEAYRGVTAATPICYFRRPDDDYFDMSACMQRTTEIPFAVSWNIPVSGSVAPDQCSVEIGTAGRVTDVQYTLGNVRE